jgi:hypothetical protein
MHRLTKNAVMRPLAVLMASILTACSTTPLSASIPDTEFASCPAYKPAYEITDRFMETFNAKDLALHRTTYHFPHVRIASGAVTVIPTAETESTSFARLAAQGWDHSAWASRRIVQCDPTKAHMLTHFIRYRADNTVLSQFNSLYIVEFKNGKWGITGRSSFAP